MIVNELQQQKHYDYKLIQKGQKMTSTNLKISVILPCYNEELTIGAILEKINNLNLPNYEIIVVDDASTDDSAAIARTYPNTKVYVHKQNKRYGRTLLDGIKKASGDLVVTIDSDGQHDPNDIPVLLKPVIEDKADIVVGSRYSGKYYYRVPFTNRTGEAFIEGLMKFVFGQSIKNNQGGFRVFHKRTLNIFDNIKFYDMAFTTELLLKAIVNDYRIVEGPIHLKDREIGQSRVKKGKLLFDIFHCFAKYGFNFLKKKYNLPFDIVLFS